MALRHLVRAALARPCVIMEEEPDLPGEDVDLASKFERLVAAHDHAAIVVVWPRGAKMAAVHDELLLLVERQRTAPLPPIYVLHHPRAARVDRGTFAILERGGRSRYTVAFQRLPVWPLPWRTRQDLERAAATVRDELDDAAPPKP
jgi:hypothetical protein